MKGGAGNFFRGLAIEPIPHKGAAYGGKMEPYLVGAAGMKPCPNKGAAIFCLQNPVLGFGGSAGGRNPAL